METQYKALLLDLDGTLIGPSGLPHPRTTAAIHRLIAGGVRVMIATGRSDAGTVPILKHLNMQTPALVFNGPAFGAPSKGACSRSAHSATPKSRASLSTPLPTTCA